MVWLFPSQFSQLSFAPPGLFFFFPSVTHGLRRGLHSCAASRLEIFLLIAFTARLKTRVLLIVFRGGRSRTLSKLYTLLNNDQAARLTSTSLRVSSCASPAKQRAISV